MISLHRYCLINDVTNNVYWSMLFARNNISFMILGSQQCIFKWLKIQYSIKSFLNHFGQLKLAIEYPHRTLYSFLEFLNCTMGLLNTHSCV